MLLSHIYITIILTRNTILVVQYISPKKSTTGILVPGTRYKINARCEDVKIYLNINTTSRSMTIMLNMAMLSEAKPLSLRACLPNGANANTRSLGCALDEPSVTPGYTSMLMFYPYE